jgi:dihydropteroate synthase
MPSPSEAPFRIPVTDRPYPAKPVSKSWQVRNRAMPLGERTLVMGIVNVTPDSFSDGGKYLNAQAAIDHGRALVEEGADILDVGGESTRPGSETVPEGEELGRVLPVLDGLKDLGVAISIDTRKANVAWQAVQHGASIINDVSALADPGMAKVAADTRAGLVLMHMLGEPKSMQVAPHYEDVVSEVAKFLRDRARIAERAGVAHDAIVLDPGIGFGKRSGKGIEDNASLLKHVDHLRSLGYPVLIGASRKSFIGNIGKVAMADRLEGSLAAAAVAAWQGAEIVRVHDVRATRRVVDLVDAVRRAP